MCGAAAAAAACRSTGLVGAAVVALDRAEHGHRPAEIEEQLRQVLDRLGDEMGHHALALEPPGDAQQPSGDHRLAEGLVDLRPDHHVRGAGLILQRQEDHPRGGAGALAGDHQPGDGDAVAVGHLVEGAVRQAFRQARAQQLHRMGAQRQAQREVILDHLLPERHRGKDHVGFNAALAIGAEERQRFRRLQRLGGPERVAPGEAERGKAVALGQPLERGGFHPGAAPEAFDIRIAVGPCRDDPRRVLLAQPLDLAQPEPQREAAVGAAFERVVPLGMVHRDRPHLDAMFTRVAHQLGGGVEPHGLRVEQRTGEDRLMVLLQPGRDIDQPREAGGVAFGKAIAAEALDLGKAALGEGPVVAPGQHPRHEPVAKGADGAHALKGGEAAAQPVGLGGGEAGGDHGDLHGLLLKERHAVGAAQHLHHRGAQILDRLLALAAVDEGMHHTALDRAGAHDGHFAHQIVEALGQHPGQEVELRPAFHLEYPDGIGAAEHVVDRAVLGRDIGQRPALAAVLHQKAKGLADAGQHPQREDIDLQKPQRVDVVLVPLDHRTVVHRRVLDRAELVEPPVGDDEAADVLREVPGEADDLLDQLGGHQHPVIGGIDPGVAHAVLVRGARRPTPDLPRKPCDHVLAQPHHLADLADRRARAEVDHRGGQPGALAPVALVDPLDHLLAPLVLEIDVDVGWLAAFLGDEALEDQRDALGRHLCDAEQVAHDRVGRRAAPLAQDAARAGEGDDVVHGEEIRGIAHLADQPQFLFHPVHDLRRRTRRVTPVQPFAREPGEPVLRRLAVLRLVRVLVAQLVEAEGAAIGDFDRAA